MSENTEKIMVLKEGIMNMLNPHLQENAEVTSYAYTFENGYSGGRLSVENIDENKELMEKLEEIEADDKSGLRYIFSQLFLAMPPWKKIRLLIKKGQELLIEEYNTKELIEEIKNTSFEEIKSNGWEKIIDKVIYTDTGENFIVDTDIDEECIKGHESQKYDFSTAYKDFEYLYYSLNKEVNEVRTVVTSEGIKVQADKVFPEWGIELINDDEDIKDIDGNDIQAVNEYIESGNDQKIRKALEVIKSNSESRKKIEKRYLNLIRARLNNPNATIEDLSKNILKANERKTLMGKNIDQSFISYSYMSDNKTKLIVDFIGAMVQNHLDIEEFIEKAKETSNEKALKELFHTCSNKLREDIKKEVDKYKEGWYGEICSKLLTMKLEKVMFEKTSFTEANKSLVLREYMFFLGMVSKDDLYMDIHQSDNPELTEVFWMLKEIPLTNWSDVTPDFPEFPLKFKRDGIMREGDFGNWRNVFDGFPSYEAARNYHKGTEFYNETDREDSLIDATKYYTKSIEHGEDGRSYYYRGLAYSDLEESEKAFDDFNKAVSLGVDVQGGYHTIGVICYYDKNYKEAFKYLSRAIEYSPIEDSYYYRGLCNHYLSDNRKALKDFNSAIEIGGELLDYLSVKGSLLGLLNECEEAISVFNIVIEMEPSAHPYESRAIAYRKIGNYEKAIEDFTAAMEYESDDSAISMLLVSRSGVYKKLNDLDNVWKDLHAAIEKDSDNASVYLDTIELYITTSMYTEGLKYIKKHEEKILENCAERQKLIFLYLKATIFIALDMSIDEFKQEIYALASKGMELEWNFSHTKEWLQESEFLQDKKEEITHLTEVLEGKIEFENLDNCREFESIRAEYLQIMKQFENNDKIHYDDRTSLVYIGALYGYIDSYDQEDELMDKLGEDKYFLKEGISKDEYENLSSRCPFEIPEILKNIWVECNGFFSSWGFKQVVDDEIIDRSLKFGILPMIEAFGGERDIERMKEIRESDKLLQWPLINYELFEDLMDYAYVDPSKVDLESILENCILLEYFSVDLLSYTLYKMDHENNGEYSQLYFTYGDGVYPLRLNLEEYFDAMLELKGVVFQWPLLFIDEDNVDSMVIGEKENALKHAKEFNDMLGLHIDFERLGL